MKKSDWFETEINYLSDNELKNFARYYFNNHVGDWFFESSASSSGKHHPEISKGRGGLVRHTKTAVRFCQDMLRLNSYGYMSREYQDYAILALLVHDTCKYGGQNYDKKNYAQHGPLAAENVNTAWMDYFNTSCPELLYMAIMSHMGQWSPEGCKPFTPLDRLVHLCDYISSRESLDVPEVRKEWTRLVKKWDKG